MTLSFTDKLHINDLANLLYNFLPASGNSSTSFPIAAKKCGLGSYWQSGSKRPAIKAFLERVVSEESHKLVPLLEEIVNQSYSWRARNKENLLQRKEVEELNKILASMKRKSKNLSDPDFLRRLDSAGEKDLSFGLSAEIDLSDETRRNLAQALMAISALQPQERGFAFEVFLKNFFKAFGLAPNPAFRLKGEQIDGSFDHDRITYLLEAKWQGQIGQADLLTFKGKVDGKSTWSRGLFVSIGGFTSDGLEAFARGKSTNIICLDGYDLSQILHGDVNLSDAISWKARRAAETNRAFVSLREKSS